MATGRLGVADLTAAANTSVYTVPSSTFAVVTCSVVNRGTTAATIRMAIATSGTPANTEWIEFDTSLAAKGVLERTGLVMDAGKILVVYSSAVNVNVVVYGIETATA